MIGAWPSFVPWRTTTPTPFSMPRSAPPADVDPSDPEAWIGAARAGERHAIERILQAVFPRVMRTCRGILGRTAEAEDAAQESLIEIARALPRYRGDGSIGGYATRITIRTAMRMRKQGSPAAVAIEESTEPAASSTATPEDAVLGQRRRRVLRALLDELPSEQAETVVLRFLLGHSLEDVATITETPRNTVRSRLRLAKAAMARRIDGDAALRDLLGVES